MVPGSAPYNNFSNWKFSIKSNLMAIFRTLVNGDENTNFNFGAGNTDSRDIFVLNC